MDWGIVISSALAGGIFGQVFTVFCTSYLTDKREFKKWRLMERHKAIIELFDVITSNPIDENDLANWSHAVRNASLKIHLLYKNGKAPDKVSFALESVFKLVQEKKARSEGPDWPDRFKESVSILRTELSVNLLTE